MNRMKTIGDALDFIRWFTENSEEEQRVTILVTDTQVFEGTPVELCKGASIGALTKSLSIMRSLRDMNHWLIVSKKVSPCVEMKYVMRGVKNGRVKI